MSQHDAKVHRLAEIRVHPNADALEVVQILGWPCCVRKDDFKAGDLVVYLEPDTLVPVAQPEFSFLAPGARPDGFARIKAMRLRGEPSMGLVVRARDGWREGKDAFADLGCQHYEPDTGDTSGENAPRPKTYHVKYDVESFRKFNTVIQEGENVSVTEKIHGASARFVWLDGQLHVGSHTNWKKDNEKSIWWKAARKYGLAEKLKEFPGVVFYGEVYGQVQKFKYGATQQNPIRLAFFDALQPDGRWWEWAPLRQCMKLELDLPLVPILYEGPWSSDLMRLADGPSTVEGASHIREGCVVKPFVNREVPELGRVILKLVSVDYLGR